MLEALLNYPTSLEKIVGVDISLKGLARAAKVSTTLLYRGFFFWCSKTLAPRISVSHMGFIRDEFLLLSYSVASLICLHSIHLIL